MGTGSSLPCYRQKARATQRIPSGSTVHSGVVGDRTAHVQVHRDRPAVRGHSVAKVDGEGAGPRWMRFSVSILTTQHLTRQAKHKRRNNEITAHAQRARSIGGRLILDSHNHTTYNVARSRWRTDGRQEVRHDQRYKAWAALLPRLWIQASHQPALPSFSAKLMKNDHCTKPDQQPSSSVLQPRSRCDLGTALSYRSLSPRLDLASKRRRPCQVWRRHSHCSSSSTQEQI